MYLRCLTHDSPRLNYYLGQNVGTSMTPFKVIYDPLKLIKYTVDQVDHVSLQEQLLKRDLTIDKLKQNLYKAQAI